MAALLGLGVGPRSVHATYVRGREIVWAGSARYGDEAELEDVIGRLAAEVPERPRRARIVLERGAVQLRTVEPAPPLKLAAARRYVALDAGRLFRRNGAALVTDALPLKANGTHVLWAGAAAEPLTRAIVRGCEQAGLGLDALGPAADVLPAALARGTDGGDVTVTSGEISEVLTLSDAGVWRSRFTRSGNGADAAWAPSLESVGAHAPEFAAAFAATQRAPRLSLLPPEARAASLRERRRSLLRVALIGLALWIGAGAAHVGRLYRSAAGAERELVALRPALDSTLALRRELRLARTATSALTAAERERSRALVALAQVTGALGDSAFLSSFRLESDATLRLTGYAPNAAQVLAALQVTPGISQARFESPVSRRPLQLGAGLRTWDGFSVVARAGGTR